MIQMMNDTVLNFGSLVNLVNRYETNWLCVGGISEHNNKPLTIEMLYGCLFAVDEPGRPDRPSSSEATNIIKHKKNPSTIASEKAVFCMRDSGTVIENVKQMILPFIVDLEAFFGELKQLIDSLPQSTMKKELMVLAGRMLVEDGTFTEDGAALFASALLFSLITQNNRDETDDETKLGLDARAWIASYDPHRINSLVKASKALPICVIEDGNEMLFYHFDSCLDYLLENGLMITRLESFVNNIYVYVRRSPLVMRKLMPEDFPQAVHFIKEHLSEFRPKKSWGLRTLDEMAENGLKCSIWTAYGIYDGDTLVAYLDYKQRFDTDIELGIALVTPQMRGNNLVVALIDYLRLKFPMNGFFAGTYEENEKMKNTLLKTSFEENLFYDFASGIKTNRIKERINPECPDDPEAYTYSVYYKAGRLITPL